MLNSQKELITEVISQALKNIGAPEDAQVLLERPKNPDHGDVACMAALQCAKAMHNPPRVIAEQIKEEVLKDPRSANFLKSIDIAGPGFINLTLSDSARQSVVTKILKENKKFGTLPLDKNKSILIEYVSANPTGPLHLGHARQGALGDILSNLYRSQGWEVTREFYYNDAGMQITNLANSVRLRAKELLGEVHLIFPEIEKKDTGTKAKHKSQSNASATATVAEKASASNEDLYKNQIEEAKKTLPENVEVIVFPDGLYRGEYVKEIASKYLQKEPVQTFDGKIVESKGDVDDLEDIRRYAVALLRNEQYDDLQAFGVSFDNYFLESSVYSNGKIEEVVEAMDKAGKLYEKDGALWFRATDYGDDLDRVVRKKDGGYTYFVPDVAYHVNKFNRGYTRALNIQGSDHFGTTARVRAGIQAWGQTHGVNIPKDFPNYMLHTMIRLFQGGQEVKMSKRAGTYVTLRDLLDWIGKDAARLFLVSRKADTEFVLDIDVARSQSDDNPVFYLQYAHARICSVFEQAKQKGYVVPTEEEALKFDLSPLDTPQETKLLNILSDYPATLASATEDGAPHLLVNYLSELAQAFHSFYNSQRVLTEDARIRNARIALLLAVRQVFKNGLAILGVSAPQRLDRPVTE
ncbi:MAG: arginine--tRNA ligase [Burkholderiales bacterium]|nr:arginine--tRNA ligase [Burkholderiales bacterium]